MLLDNDVVVISFINNYYKNKDFSFGIFCIELDQVHLAAFSRYA